MNVKMHKVNQRQAVEMIRTRAAFEASALSGRYVDAGEASLGSLPDPERALFREAERKADALGRRLYVVFSYQTPIAWVMGDEVTIPSVRYSLTTSRHQSRVRFALPRATSMTPSKGRAVPVGTYGPRTTW
jgi:hypothetical protein